MYRDDSVKKPHVPEELLRKLLLQATTEVEFSFNDVIYRQVDGVAMGSPLGPVLANIFVGFYEQKIPDEEMPRVYNRFVDDTFSITESEKSCREFFDRLNSLHPALQFTMDMEADNKLPFLDVLVQRINGQAVRSMYRKPTFTGLYSMGFFRAYKPKDRIDQVVNVTGA